MLQVDDLIKDAIDDLKLAITTLNIHRSEQTAQIATLEKSVTLLREWVAELAGRVTELENNAT